MNIFDKIKCILIYFLLSVHFIQLIIMCVITAKRLLCFKLLYTDKVVFILQVNNHQWHFWNANKIHTEKPWLFFFFLNMIPERESIFMKCVSILFLFHIWYSSEFLCYIAKIKIFNLKPWEKCVACDIIWSTFFLPPMICTYFLFGTFPPPLSFNLQNLWCSKKAKIAQNL